MRSLTRAIALTMALCLTASAVPRPAHAADGKTTTAEIVGGGVLLYLLGKLALASAATKSSVAAANQAADNLNGPRATILALIDDTADANGVNASEVDDYATVRNCWNRLILDAPPSGTNTDIGSTCVAFTAKRDPGVDSDAIKAFNSAPSIYQQIIDGTVSGNVDANAERVVVLRRMIANFVFKHPVPGPAPASIIGDLISKCSAATSSVDSAFGCASELDTIVAGIAKANATRAACGFAAKTWLPPIIRLNGKLKPRPRPEPDYTSLIPNWKDFSFAPAAGC